ncbi:conserved hypothetical protein [Xenorhabdus bovienii str. kraussei Quebec]|uniref:Uncharacterized protein n=1 Tax=Xenorhabdus bovienii str. kraussei Quebec TaxID=1398203 RepID=A0A077PBT2_XENBV|nr:hypothetical protein [Xenorhabdus bovienii]CDH21930.1 conserved hypothetical protein [Xenorhabdus bovienii str. kraussei Quebec]
MSITRFAHLIPSFGMKSKMSEEEQDEKKKGKKARKAEEDKDETDAENDDPDAEGNDDDKEKEGKKAKKVKKAKSEEDDDDDDPDAEDDKDDENAEEDEDVKKGRRAERKRCAKIFGSQYAAGRPDMAAHLALNTRMSASEAISTLKAMGTVQLQPSRASLDSRMRTEQQVRVGPDASQPTTGSPEALVSKMTRLYDTNKGTK